MTPESTPSAIDQGPLGPTGVRWLKIAIVVMGIMILAGLLAVVARIIYLAGRPVQGARAPVAVSAIAAAPSVALPPGAVVRTMALDGGRLALHYDAPAGSGVVVVDLETGAAVSRIEFVPQAPRN